MYIIRFMKLDLHIHSQCSFDSTLSPEEIIIFAKATGLDGVGITDHQNMDIRRLMTEGRQSNGVFVFFGMEYETAEGDFLLYGPFEDLPAGLNARHLLDIVARKGGIAIAAHPFRAARPVAESLIDDSLCRTVESINGRNRQIENRQVSHWRKRYPLVEVGGSDAHTPMEIGRVFTRLHVPVCSRAGLVKAIQNNRCHPELNPLHLNNRRLPEVVSKSS